MGNKRIFSMANGYAQAGNFEDTLENAIKVCEKESRFMNTRNWLYQKSDNGHWFEVGHTVKEGYFWNFKKDIINQIQYNF